MLEQLGSGIQFPQWFEWITTLGRLRGLFYAWCPMVNPVVAWLISQLAGVILGSDVFGRVLGVVERWAETEISSAEKRHGVLAEIETIGLKLTESAARFGVELAVQYLKRVK